MRQDTADIDRAMNVIWAARALERIGDHAKNISEYVVFLVKGQDVRHSDKLRAKQPPDPRLPGAHTTAAA
jgi:phosphate transport system protein